MKNILKVLGIIALATVIGFSMAGCSNPASGDGGGGTISGSGSGGNGGGTGGGPQKVTYISEDNNGNKYTLEINESGRRSVRSAAQAGDTFKFTVEYNTVVGGGNLAMKFEYSGIVGSAQIDGASVSLTLAINGETITITIVGTDMTVITGKIINNSGEEVVNNSGTLTPVGGSDGGGGTSGGGTGGDGTGGNDDNGNGNGNENNAITWTAVTDSTFGSSSIWKIVYGAGKFVAVGADGKMAYSTDGISWTAVPNSPFDANNYMIAIAYGDGKFVVAGGSLYNPIHKVAYSTNGITWTVGTNTISTETYDMAYGGGKFVMGRRNMAYSTNGQTWTAASLDCSSYPYLTLMAIAYGNGRFVAGGSTGYAGKIAYSTNGETWTLVEDSTIDTNDVVTGIAYGSGKFVKVGGGIAYSTDGLTWTKANTNYGYSSDFGSCIAYGGGKFVASSFGRTAYSIDGVTWIENSSGSGYATGSIAYGGTAGSRRFILGDSGGHIFYSNVQE